MVQQVPVVVEAHHFAACPETGVDAHDAFFAQGGRQEQLAQVFGEHANGFQVGFFFAAVAEFGFDGGLQQAFVPVFERQPHLFGRTAGAGDEQAFEIGDGLFFIGGHGYAQEAFLFAAAHGQQAVRRAIGEFFAPFKVVLVFGGGFVFAFDQAGGDDGVFFKMAAGAGARAGVFADPLRHDVACPLQGIVYAGYLIVEVRGGEGFHVAVALGVQALRKGFEALVDGHGGAGFALGAVGQVQVFEFGEGGGGFKGFFELGGEFALFGYAVQYGLPSFVEFLEFFELVCDVGYLHFV